MNKMSPRDVFNRLTLVNVKCEGSKESARNALEFGQ